MYGWAHTEIVCSLKIEVGRTAPSERVWASFLMKRSTVKRWLQSLMWDSPSGSLFPFGQLSHFFSHTWPVLGPCPTCTSNVFLGWMSLQRPVGYIHTYCRVEPPPFWPPRSLRASVRIGKFSLTSGVVILSFYFSRAQLLSLVLSLECLGVNKTSNLLHFKSTSCPVQGLIYLLPQ